MLTNLKINRNSVWLAARREILRQVVLHVKTHDRFRIAHHVAAPVCTQIHDQVKWETLRHIRESL